MVFGGPPFPRRSLPRLLHHPVPKTHPRLRTKDSAMTKYQTAVCVSESLPSLDGVQHRFLDIGNGISIHVAEAGPFDGPPVMLVHGFPQNWWEWRDIIGPLAADGYRVLCPDLRGAGWSSAPPGPYLKIDMADDLAAVIDHLGVGPVTVVAHDW